MPLPVGTVSFLFSDIEDSTGRWEVHRDAMRRALALHDELMRAVVERHRGYVFKTVGDEFCTAFANPEDALAAAIDAQRTLRDRDWSAVDGLRVRMAIHAGVVELRDNDYFGPPVNRVARLLGAAHGEQILVSHVGAELLETGLPAGVSLRDLGGHRLKGLPHAETIFQVIANGLRDEFPPLRTLGSHPTNVPLELSSFFGREDEIAEIEALLRDARLVTLTGSGGVGKTRTALHVAARRLLEYPDGVWFVDLAPVSDSNLVAATIARVFNIDSVGGARSAIDELELALQNRELLIVLDNCEHVVAAAAVAGERILRHCGKVRVLATSREPLGIEGERAYRMPSLNEATAIDLFTARAQAVNPRFEIGGTTRAVVADIVRRLDGIPLAIELAASRVKILSVERIARGLDDRFKVLTGGCRTALPRQQTLRSMIGWSYDLLSEQERRMLRNVAVFRGGWTFDAAEQICVDDRLAQWDCAALLESLVDKSLIVADAEGADVRYRVLESTRAYARERATENGELDAIAARHARYFQALSESFYYRYWRMDLDEWHTAMAPDFDNFRAAIDWALADRRDVAAGIAIVANLADSLVPERRDLTVAAVAAAGPELSEGLRGKASLAHARNFGDSSVVMESALQAVAIFERTGDAAMRAEALVRVGGAHWRRGRIADAVASGREALALALDLDVPRLQAWIRTQLGLWTLVGGDERRGRELMEQAIAALRELGDWRRMTLPLAHYAEALFASGDPDGAIRYVGEAMALDERAGNRDRRFMRNLNVAAYLLSLGRMGEAWRAARAALEDAAARNQELPVAIGIGHLAQIAAYAGDASGAAKMLGYADSVYARQQGVREFTELQGYDATVARLNATLSKEALAELAAQGAAMAQEAAVALALGVAEPARVTIVS